MKNDYLEKLLSDDAKFQLHDTESFRHKLLVSRIEDPNYSKIPIPQINSQLIDDQRGKFYLEWLEEIHRQ